MDELVVLYPRNLVYESVLCKRDHIKKVSGKSSMSKARILFVKQEPHFTFFPVFLEISFIMNEIPSHYLDDILAIITVKSGR